MILVYNVCIDRHDSLGNCFDELDSVVLHVSI